MNICLIGDFSENLDEGYKNASHYLAQALEKHYTVARLDGKRLGTLDFWRVLSATQPDILHLIAQPTRQSLVFARLLQILRPGARTAVSALRAERFFPRGRIGQCQRWLLRLARPDLILVQTPEAEALFSQLGCAVAQLPNGVDLERFRPAHRERKRQLRQQYNLDPDRPLVLHVGHLEAARNLMALKALPKAQIQVLVAGSVYMGTDHDLIGQLQDAGFHLLVGYQPHVEDLYMLADCYVFPLEPGDSLSMPLSVLEAMASNLPVITTPFAGLVAAFEAGGGLTYVEPGSSFLPHVKTTLASSEPPATREKVAPYSWHSVVGQLQAHYQGLLDR